MSDDEKNQGAMGASAAPSCSVCGNQESVCMDFDDRHGYFSPKLILDVDNGVDFTSKGLGLKGNR